MKLVILGFTLLRLLIPNNRAGYPNFHLGRYTDISINYNSVIAVVIIDYKHSLYVNS